MRKSRIPCATRFRRIIDAPSASGFPLKAVFEYSADANLRCNFNQSDKMPFIRWNRFPPERK